MVHLGKFFATFAGALFNIKFFIYRLQLANGFPRVSENQCYILM